MNFRWDLKDLYCDLYNQPLIKIKKMAWSYRILAEKDGDKVVFQIHEVYLDKNGKPDSYTTNGVTVHSESLQGISSVLDKMRECIDKPILSLEEFPKEYDGETSLVMRDS